MAGKGKQLTQRKKSRQAPQAEIPVISSPAEAPTTAKTNTIEPLPVPLLQHPVPAQTTVPQVMAAAPVYPVTTLHPSRRVRHLMERELRARQILALLGSATTRVPVSLSTVTIGRTAVESDVTTYHVNEGIPSGSAAFSSDRLDVDNKPRADGPSYTLPNTKDARAREVRSEDKRHAPGVEPATADFDKPSLEIKSEDAAELTASLIFTMEDKTAETSKDGESHAQTFESGGKRKRSGTHDSEVNGRSVRRRM